MITVSYSHACDRLSIPCFGVDAQHPIASTRTSRWRRDAQTLLALQRPVPSCTTRMAGCLLFIATQTQRGSAGPQCRSELALRSSTPYGVGDPDEG